MSPPNDAAPPSDDETLETLLFETLERLEVEGAPAMAEAIAAHPEHEAELRRRIDALRSVGLVELPEMGPELAPVELPDAIGPYELRAPLGEGGMGLVFAARDRDLERDIAIKLIRPELVARGSIQARFQREARAISRLQHPGVVRVIEAGNASGIPYLAMERVRGCTLAAVLDALRGRSPAELTGSDLARAVADLTGSQVAEPHPGEPHRGGESQRVGCEARRSSAINPWSELGWAEAVTRIHRDLAEGLEQAHAAGVLHRDVKASNVMLTPEGRALLIDFGLAWIDASATLTATQGRLGSLPYTAPEQITTTSAPSPAGDVYSLGVVLYEALTLTLPFRAGSEAGLTRAIESGTPEPPGRINRSVPAPMIECVQRALRRDPRRRPPSAAAFAHDLSRSLRGLPPVPHGDGPWNALASAWRAQPFVGLGLAAAAILLLALPATLLALQARTLESTSASAELSVARLGIAARASEQLRRSFPRSSLLAGSPLGDLRAGAERDANALRTLAVEVGVDLPGAPMPAGDASGDEALLQAATDWRQALEGGQNPLAEGPGLRATLAELRERARTSPSAIDLTDALAGLLAATAAAPAAALATEPSIADRADEFRAAARAEALTLLRQLEWALPGSIELAARRTAVEASLAPAGDPEVEEESR